MPAEPFDTLLGPEFRRAVAVRVNEALQDEIEQIGREPAIPTENEQHLREPERPSWALHQLLPIRTGSVLSFSRHNYLGRKDKP